MSYSWLSTLNQPLTTLNTVCYNVWRVPRLVHHAHEYATQGTFGPRMHVNKMEDAAWTHSALDSVLEDMTHGFCSAPCLHPSTTRAMAELSSFHICAANASYPAIAYKEAMGESLRLLDYQYLSLLYGWDTGSVSQVGLCWRQKGACKLPSKPSRLLAPLLPSTTVHSRKIVLGLLIPATNIQAACNQHLNPRLPPLQ